jgi:hypothetical protein
MTGSAVTEEELARARQLVEREPNYSPFNHDFYRLDLDKVYSLMALYARQEREAERERVTDDFIAIVIREITTSTGPTGGWCDSPKAICASIVDKLKRRLLADRIRKGEPSLPCKRCGDADGTLNGLCSNCSDVIQEAMRNHSI